MKSSTIFSSDLQNISIAEQVVDNISTQYNISSEVYGNILVSIIESVTNAIKHGNKLDTSKNVTFTYEVFSNEIVFFIEDEGNGFDYTSIADPTLPDNIEKPDGRGVFLINNLADKVEFLRNGAGIKLNFTF